MKKYIDKIRQKDTESGLYIIGIGMLILGILTYKIFRLFGSDPFTVLGTRFGICPFYRVTGLLCPGCGGTRAFHAFITGHFIKSFINNAFVWYVMTCYMCFMISHTVRIFTKGRYSGIVFRMRYIYIGIIIMLLQWGIKNVALHIC